MAPGRLSSQWRGGTVEAVMLRTALHDHLAAGGAVHAPDRGVLLPSHFGDPQGEYAALVDGAALVDLGYRVLVVASGADRVSFLHGMLTNDIAGLRPGEGCPALLLTIQGRVTADLRVAVLPEEILLDVDVRARADLQAALEALIIADDVTLADPREATALIALEGPQAMALLPSEIQELPPYAHAVASIAGVPARIVRASEVKGPGAIAHVPAARASRLWDALVRAGARPCGLEALEGRRVEVGVPRIGLDMGAGTLSLELPLTHAVSDRKGCYLGQEVVARGTARGQVRRTLVPLLLDDPAPSPGAPVLENGKEVGRVTSVARAFGLGGLPVALALVRREVAEPGRELRIAEGETSTRARVAIWPLA